MEKDIVMERIEEVRGMMIHMANEKGFLHPLTIEMSQKLDKILNEFSMSYYG